jgi:hypothetical protein
VKDNVLYLQLSGGVSGSFRRMAWTPFAVCSSTSLL